MWGLTAFFGFLGVGSLWKPDSVGAVVSQFIENFATSEKESDSHNKQIQKKSSGGVQVMAHGSNVNISVPSEKKERKQYPEEEKEILRKETIVVRPSKGYSYDFDFVEGDYLKGEISSTSCIDIYFVDDVNFDKWDRDKSFEVEDSNEDVLESNINYFVPADGAWHLIIENNGRKSARVKVRLYVT